MEAEDADSFEGLGGTIGCNDVKSSLATPSSCFLSMTSSVELSSMVAAFK